MVFLVLDFKHPYERRDSVKSYVELRLSPMTHHHHGLIFGNLGKVSGGHALGPLDHLVGSPAEVRNCLTVDALIPKFTFSGREPSVFATLSLFSCEITTPMMLPFSS